MDLEAHIQFDKAYYSVPHELRGEYVLARRTDTQVTIFRNDIELVAVHTPAPPGKRRTKEEHYPPNEFSYMKYGVSRLEAACSRAVFFNNYSYSGIKTILEKELDKQNILPFCDLPEKQLNPFYARNIKELLKEISDGNICTN